MQSDVKFPLVLYKPTSQIIQPKFNQCKRFVLHPHFPVIYLTLSILGSSPIFGLSLKYTLRFVPSTWCAFSYEGEFSFYNSKRQKMAKSSLFNWRQSVSATATISHVDLSFSLVHYRNELQEGNHLNTLLGDASAVWRMKKLRLSAELRNLFNKKNYMETIYSGISTLTDSYYLRHRELIISAQYSF